MPNLTHLRLAAREIFDEALRAVDAESALRQAIRIHDSKLTIRNTPIDVPEGGVYSIAIGKAAYPLAFALESVLGEALKAGVISSAAPLRTSQAFNRDWKRFEGGHPLPNEASFAAGREALSLLERANDERALVIFLISGGGSAMLELPANDEISLEDIRAANRVLVNCGASITEVNSVRRTFSAVKGGKLAARAPRCDQITLIISDVPPDAERYVASGPSLLPPTDSPQPLEVIAKYDLRKQLPASIIQAIERDAPDDAASNQSQLRKHWVLLSNDTALETAASAAQSRGFITEIATDISDQPIEQGCELLRQRLNALRMNHDDANAPVCLISGGEFACRVQGEGIGGRNLETALRLASSTNLGLSDTVALCAGTDGIDGNSPAAGAIVDSTTLARAESIGLDVKDFLQRSDSYSFFVALGDVVTTGATRTNVRDIRILLAPA